MQQLLQEIKACEICEAHLPLGPNPVVQAGKNARIVLIGQAPGTKVHKSGVPWDDPSGNLLRKWLNVDKDVFYDPEKIALIPMGFCYPGKGKSGDLPPRKECAPLWHVPLFEQMSELELIILIGTYSQAYYLKENPHKNLTETVRAWRQFQPRYLPLPHPSPRNRFWLSKNPWFETEVIPALQEKVTEILADG